MKKDTENKKRKDSTKGDSLSFTNLASYVESLDLGEIHQDRARHSS